MSDYMKELRSKVGHRLLEIPSVSIVVRDEQNRMLLVQHENDGVWVTPGGAVEPTEVPADAAAREMWEETGLEVELTRILGVYGGPEFVVNYQNGDRTSYLMVVFEGTRRVGELRPDGVETLDARFFAREEIDRLRRPAWLDEVVEDAYAGHRGAAFRGATWSAHPVA